MRDKGVDVVDVKSEPEEEYAAHCRQADELTRPLRDCITYYNGHEAEPGSLAYYGGGTRHKYRIRAQETLEPYVFDSRRMSLRSPWHPNPVGEPDKRDWLGSRSLHAGIWIWQNKILRLKTSPTSILIWIIRPSLSAPVLEVFIKLSAWPTLVFVPWFLMQMRILAALGITTATPVRDLILRLYLQLFIFKGSARRVALD